MANTFITNKLTDYVALRLGENLGYLTVGSRKYFANQLEGKRNGQTYDFILRGTTDAVNRLEIDPSDNLDIVEKKVSLKLDPWHIAVRTGSIETVTDTDWDKAVAIPEGAKLANGIVRSQIQNDLGSCATAFVGSGFVPLAKASAHLQSISNEKIFGFIHPTVEAVLTSNGQHFAPVGSPDTFYKQGLLGTFHSAEYRAQRFMPQVVVSESLANAFDETAKVTAYEKGDGVDTVTLSLGSFSGKIPAGFVFHIADVYAADLIGDPTANLYAFIVTEDANASGGTVTVKIKPIIFESGAKSIVKADGSEWSVAELANCAVSTPCEAGTYFAGVLRLDGSYEAEWLNHLDASNSETKYGQVNGITCVENRVFDPMKMTNLTRWDVVKLAGVVESRGVAYVLIK